MMRTVDRAQRSDHRARAKRWRRPYRQSRTFDSSCRCHGGCGYCLSNRMRQRRGADIDAIHELNDAGLDLFIVAVRRNPRS